VVKAVRVGWNLGLGELPERRGVQAVAEDRGLEAAGEVGVGFGEGGGGEGETETEAERGGEDAPS
jgi:hypothetical protein